MIDYIVKDNEILQTLTDDKGKTKLEHTIKFEDIVYIALTVDKETQRAFILNIVATNYEYSIEHDDNADLLNMYQAITPFLLEKGFSEDEEDIDDDFYMIYMKIT